MTLALAEKMDETEQAVRFPDTTELVQRIENVTSREAVVENEASYVQGIEIYKTLQAFEDAAKDEYREEKALAHSLHKRLCDKESALLKPILEAKRRWNTAITNYRREQEAKAAEEARKAQEKADKQAQREVTKEAKALEKQGEVEAAESLRNQTVTAPLVQQRAALPEVKGVSGSMTYRAEVIDLSALVKAVSEGRVPLKAITADQSFLNKQARALENQLDYPGVKVIAELKTNIRKSS